MPIGHPPRNSRGCFWKRAIFKTKRNFQPVITKRIRLSSFARFRPGERQRHRLILRRIRRELDLRLCFRLSDSEQHSEAVSGVMGLSGGWR